MQNGPKTSTNDVTGRAVIYAVFPCQRTLPDYSKDPRTRT